ncbi:hypothetical protein ACSSS7_005060 [Eimeria intestinalis]
MKSTSAAAALCGTQEEADDAFRMLASPREEGSWWSPSDPPPFAVFAEQEQERRTPGYLPRPQSSNQVSGDERLARVRGKSLPSRSPRAPLNAALCFESRSTSSTLEQMTTGGSSAFQGSGKNAEIKVLEPGEARQ